MGAMTSGRNHENLSRVSWMKKVNYTCVPLLSRGKEKIMDPETRIDRDCPWPFVMVPTFLGAMIWLFVMMARLNS